MKTLFDNYNSDPNRMPKIVNKIRLEAIARKAIREGQNINALTEDLMADTYFQEKEEKLGVRKAAQLARNTIKKAIAKETANL